MKSTKIVCTIGPASEDKEVLTKMIKSGLNVARLNFSHGSYKHHTLLVKNIRSVATRLDQPVAILQDLQGPRIRTGDVGQEGIKISAGEKIFLVPENYKVTLKEVSTFIPIQYPNLYRDLEPGDEILIDDGKIQLEVTKIKDKAIACKVKIGDVVTTHRGMNFPGVSINTPPITEKDIEDLKFGLKQKVDFIALSFVKNANDIIDLRKKISEYEKRMGRRIKDYKKPERGGKWPKTITKIIAKIERPEAVANFEEILKAADGIMVARGDLGLEVPLEDLPMIQKKIVRRCIQQAKPVIVATQMLDSMIKYPMPTRAEVSDVANAILDGADAIMLSGETATGQYPLKAVQVMSRIAKEAEKMDIIDYDLLDQDFSSFGGITETVSDAVKKIADDVNAKLIVCATTAGFTARSIVKFRPKNFVIALTALPEARNQLCLSWGVKPYTLPLGQDFNDLVVKIRKLLLQKKLVKSGDIVVIAASHPLGFVGQTNLVKVETI